MIYLLEIIGFISACFYRYFGGKGTGEGEGEKIFIFSKYLPDYLQLLWSSRAYILRCLLLDISKKIVAIGMYSSWKIVVCIIFPAIVYVYFLCRNSYLTSSLT